MRPGQAQEIKALLTSAAAPAAASGRIGHTLMGRIMEALSAISFPRPSALLVLGAVTAGVAVWGLPKLFKRIQYVGKNESVLVKKLTEKVAINGPTVYFPNPLTTLSYTKRKAINLTALQYVVVEDEQSGDIRVVSGPTLLFLGPYEAAAPVREKSVLGPNQAVTVTNKVTGEQRLVKGPVTHVPGPLEEVSGHSEAITLTKKEYIKLQDKLTGRVWVEHGPAHLFLDPNVVALGSKQSAYSLEAHQYIRLQDQLTGNIRVERGEQLLFPTAFETRVDTDTPTGIKDCIDLTRWEYCKIQDRTTGKVRVERGEKLVWLGGTERVMGREKEQAVKVDAENAVLVLNQSTGEQRLVEAPQLFFPTEHEAVIEVRHRIKLADNEAVVLKDQEGKYHYRYGDPAKNSSDASRSFFLPPYWELVTLMWSRGRRRERRDLAITIFDMRAQYMSFEFNCRTSDNVEMILEGTFFWEVVDLPAMLRYTGDAPGDVCAHARSCFIELVSKVTLQVFMDTFNQIAHAAHSNDDTFYSQRGIKIHSLEVTRYQCADSSTSAILEAIIQETTNRMNRLSCQESENEVALAKLRGMVEQERATGEVLAIQHEHELASARAGGVSEAERCTAFLAAMEAAGVASKAEDFWHVLRKNDALATIAAGKAHVYFTPQDAKLTIENRPSAA